jgi:tripartite-type tricarboxylate transporter receptor subunit TctC
MAAKLRSGRITVRALKWLLVAALLAGLAGPGGAQEFPNRTVRIIAGFVPSSSTDIIARLMANQWSNALGQQFVVENRPGAASAIAADLVARSPADGHTLLVGGTVNLTTGLINPQQAFDIRRDFMPVIVVAGQPMILTVHPSVGVNSVQELIALAKSKPGELLYGSTGVGANPHLLTELFSVRTGIKMTHVPYQGSPQATTDLLAGRIHLMLSPAAAVLPHIASGALKGLASTGPRRSASVPNLPTMMEAGVPNFEGTLWFAFWAPSGTPRDTINKLSRAGNDALKSAEVKRLFETQGFDAMGGTPEEFAAFSDREIEKWGAAATAAGMRK